MSGRNHGQNKAVRLSPAVLNISFIEPDILSARDLSTVLGDADRIEAWLAAVRARATTLATRGESVAGYKLVTRRITRRWCNEGRALKALRCVIRGTGLKQADLFERRLKSPAGLEKMFSPLGRSAVDAVGAQVSVLDNGFVLVPESDPRAAVQPRQAVEPVRRRPRPLAQVTLRPGARRSAPGRVEERAAMN